MSLLLQGVIPRLFLLNSPNCWRKGNNYIGSITALYTVLVEGDDFNEPVSDTARGILDGHISLSRDLAARNHYPAVDILESVSRVMPDIVDKTHLEAAGRIKSLLAAYREAEDLINIGAYQPGSNPVVDEAISKISSIRNYLKQGIEEKVEFEETCNSLLEIAG